MGAESRNSGCETHGVGYGRAATLLAGALLLLAGCRAAENLRRSPTDRSPSERYLDGLREAGLGQTALAQKWVRAGGVALMSPDSVDLPYREAGFVAADQPAAMSWRFPVRQGQVLEIQAELTGGEIAKLFLDLYRVGEDSGRTLRRVTEVGRADRGLRYTPSADEWLVLRLQTELLRDLEYVVAVEVSPSLAFPVSGQGPSAIRSFWGAPRDGGRRRHQGIDIFAPRGTPAIAAASGLVRRVQSTALGGRVVWIRDGHASQSLYYAHLDSQLVHVGASVQRGDTIGLIGNSGNARTTAPHLHFGIYQPGRGAVNPLHFVRPVVNRPPQLPDSAKRAMLGRWTRAGPRGGTLRGGLAPHAPVRRRVRERAPLRVTAVAGGSWRVATLRGVTGWLSPADLERSEPPPASERVRHSAGGG